MNSDLQLWLETATQNLVPAAKARVYAQIQEHHADAVLEHQHHPNPEARALANLGDVQLARQYFEQVYLTNAELGNQDKYWLAVKKLNPVYPVLLFGFNLFILFWGFFTQTRFEEFVAMAAICCLTVLSLCWQTYAAKTKGLAGFAYANLWVSLVLMPLTLGVSVVHLWLQGKFFSSNTVFILFLLVFFWFGVPKHHAIWRKLK
jgi:uncharacterized membrane protein